MSARAPRVVALAGSLRAASFDRMLLGYLPQARRMRRAALTE